MRKPPALKAGPGQLVHHDQQQCSLAEHPEGPHTHELCRCDPDTGDGNVRHHIKRNLDGHWPLTPGQEVVICPVCRGAVKKTSAHKAALSHEPLAKR